jgi:hypothetical protein
MMTTPSKPDNSHNTPETPSRWPSFVVYALLGVAAWFWLLTPIHHITQAPVIKVTKQQSFTPPGPAFWKRTQAYKRAMASPLLRSYARSFLVRTISRQVTTSRIERSFRQLLSLGSLTQWKQRETQWEAFFRRAIKAFPTMQLEAYRAYYRLQAGQFNRLLRDMPQHKVPPPTNRQTALLHIWLGHAAFWSGHPARASHHYTLVEKGFSTHPRWDQRSTHNWRLPAERSTVLYHLGLLAMHSKQHTQAVGHFGRLATRWAQLRAHPERSVDIYMARSLAFLAATYANNPTLAHTWHTRAKSFVGDSTQLQMWHARYLLKQPKATTQLRGQRILKTLSASLKRYKHSYTDTRAIAVLTLAAHHFAHKRHAKGIALLQHMFRSFRYRNPPGSLSLLNATNTLFFRFAPATPDVYQRLLTHWPHKQVTSRPASQPTSRPSSHTTPYARLKTDITLLLALSWLKQRRWSRAKLILTQLLQKPPHLQTAQEAHLYLGQLANINGKTNQTKQHFLAYYKAFPKQPTAAFWLAWQLRKTQPALARQLMTPWRQHPAWKRTWGMVFPSKKQRKQWTKVTKRMGFWWRLLGAKGRLTTHDPILSRTFLFERHRKAFVSHPLLKRLFVNIRTSHLHGRFGLQTLLTKAIVMTTLTTTHTNEHKQYTRQAAFLSSLTTHYPELNYLFDRALYSHQHGTIALGFF